MEGRIMNQVKQGILLCMMTFAFWAVLYPQFSLVEESYVCQGKEKHPKEDLYEILDAKKGEVILKSKLLELLRERYMENEM